MRRQLAIVAIVGAICLVAAANSNARSTRIVSWWNGHGIGTYYVQHPHKLGLVMAGTNYQGYWLLRDIHWSHWGNRRAKARGKLASAALDGTRVRVRVRRHTYRSCLHAGDKVNFYSRAKIRIEGEHGWRKIPHRSLAPQCNNSRRASY